MKVLAIDLGDTTGYVYVRTIERVTESHLLHYGTCALGRPMPHQFKPDVVVIERPAFTGPRSRQLAYEEAIHKLKTTYGARRVRVIQAADWMPRFGRYPLPARGVLATQHEKEAYRMAMWALEKYEEED
jgi:hypothetical protein